MHENEISLQQFKSLINLAITDRAHDLLEKGEEIHVVDGGFDLDSHLRLVSWEGGPILVPSDGRYLMIATHDQIKLFTKFYEAGEFDA